jgi:hypothetical protein
MIIPHTIKCACPWAQQSTESSLHVNEAAKMHQMMFAVPLAMQAHIIWCVRVLQSTLGVARWLSQQATIRSVMTPDASLTQDDYSEHRRHFHELV